MSYTYQQLLNCIAKNVKREREKTFLSVRGYADELEIANSTLYSLEGGVANPRIETLYKISEHSGIPITELFQDTSADICNDLFDVIHKLRKQAASLSNMADTLQSYAKTDRK